MQNGFFRPPQVIQGRFPSPLQRTASHPQVRLGHAFQLPGPLTLNPPALGSPIPLAVLRKMEAFFAADLSGVRLHLGPQAQAIGALAFTAGNDIYFAQGQLDTATSHGQRLLGHELAHVLQQRAGRVANPFGSGLAVVQDPLLEAEADRLGTQAASFQIPVQAKPAPLTAPAARGGAGGPARRRVVQPKVGFEFQTNWHIVPSSWSVGSGHLVNTPLLKSTALLKGVGWQLTSDGGEAEFVTEPFEETDNNRLRLVFASMIGFVNQLKANRIGTQPMPLSAEDGVTLVGRLAAIRPHATGNVLAVPQMTAGIRLDRFRTAMKSAGQLGQNNANFNYSDAHAGLLELAADRAARRFINKSVKFRSLVALVATYVSLSSNYSSMGGIASEGVKKITTIMSRSNLGSAFRLTPEYQNAQGNPVAITGLKADFLNAILAVAGHVSAQGNLMHGNLGPNMRMIPPLLHKNLPNATGPTVQEFAEGMVDGRDLLYWGWTSEMARWSAGGNSMGNMGVEAVGPTDHQGRREQGIVVEFRNFNAGLDSAQWSIWAESLMRWIVQVNDPATFNPAFNWQGGQVLPPAPQIPSQFPLKTVLATGALGTALALRYFGYA